MLFQSVFRAYLLELRRCVYFYCHFTYHKGNAFSHQRLLTEVMMTQHLCACSFIKSDVTGVVHHTTGIGIFIVDAKTAYRNSVVFTLHPGNATKVRAFKRCYYTRAIEVWE